MLRGQALCQTAVMSSTNGYPFHPALQKYSTTFSLQSYKSLVRCAQAQGVAVEETLGICQS